MWAGDGKNLALQSHKPYLCLATLSHHCEALQENTEDKEGVFDSIQIMALATKRQHGIC